MSGGLTVIKSEVAPRFFAVFAIFGHALGEMFFALMSHVFLLGSVNSLAQARW